jgi:adenylate cyclase
VGPLLGFGLLQVYIIGRRVVVEQRAKEQIKGMFGSYVSPELVDRMVALREMPRLGGHDEEITAYFSDIQDFSTFAEILPPERLVDLMNEYLSECTDIVQAEGGTLDKYIGDAVVAMFGAPIPLPDHAYRACLATLRVQARLGELREKWRNESGQWPELVWHMQSRIGLNSGRVVVGNMGSTRRFNYTMMGDNVNVAARMESGAKEWGVYAMCTESTKLDCEKFGGDRVVFRPLGRVRVKGRSIAVPIHEIVALKGSLTAPTAECLELFARGLARYYERDWAGAREWFERSSRLEPNAPGVTPGVTRNPSTVYLDITAQYLIQPPPRSWDGIFVMKDK